MSRRQLLRRAAAGGAAAAVAALLAACTSAAVNNTRRVSPAAGTPVTHRYGSDSSQFGQLYTPPGTPRVGTVVLIHGGYWKSGYGLDLMTPLALDLVGRGWMTWNLEYRRVGNGGGWPATFDDVAAGIDLLASSALGVDTSKVIAIGHSAGGHLAAWAAGRHKLPAGAPGASPRVKLAGAVSLAGVLNLRSGFEQDLGGGAVEQLIGGTPSSQPTRYAQGDPIELLPVGVPVRCIHGRSDTTVPISQSESYVQAAKAAGDDATLTRISGDHFTVIDPRSASWKTTLGELDALIG